MNRSPMELSRISLVFLFALSSTLCFPSRPLNERSTELAWQAWLLLDDQNQNRQDGDGAGEPPRRRITAKSIFVHQNLTMKPCPEGFKSDGMGRCNKLIEIDVQENEKFMLGILQNLFPASNDADGPSEDNPSAGPLRIDISIDGDGNSESATVLMLSPDLTLDTQEEDIVKDDAKAIFQRADDSSNAGGSEGGNLNVDKMFSMDGSASLVDLNQDGQLELTTATAIHEETTTFIPDTTTEQSLDEVTESTGTLPETTTVAMETTTEENRQALFFLAPISEPEHVPNNGPENAEATPIQNDPITATLPTNIINDSLTTATATLPAENDASKQKQVGLAAANVDHLDPVSAEGDPKENTNYVRFPSDSDFDPHTSSYASHYTYPEYSSNSYNPFFDDHSAKRHIFDGHGSTHHRDTHHDFESGGDFENFNHRNRDRHDFAWNSPSSQHKPLGFRFPTRHSNSRRASEDFHPGTHSERYYRDFPGEDLSHIFGSLRHRQQHFR